MLAGQDSETPFAVNDTGAATGQLLHHGVSETLLGLFIGLAETTLPCGARRFPEAAVAELRRAILCRHYAGLTLELAHYLDVLVRGDPDPPGSVLNACYLHNVTTRSRFEQALAEGHITLPPGAGVRQGVLHCDASVNVFQVHLRRLPLLLALLELLLFIDPACLTPDPAAAPGALAARWQKQLYAFLTEHAQPAHLQQKCYRALQWLTQQLAGPVEAGSLTDALVLDYWLGASRDEDARRFRGVAELFLYLRQALRVGRDALAAGHGEALEDSREGLVLEAGLAAWIDSVIPCREALCRYPKFLTGSNWARCEVIARHADAMTSLPLTLLRMVVMGDHQARILEALKRRQAPPWDSMATTDGYQSWRRELEAIAGAAVDCQWACVQVLLDAGEYTEALALLAELDAAAFAGADDGTLARLLQIRAPAALQAASLQLPGLNHALARARAALRGNNRAGFRAADRAEPEAYGEGAASLARLRGDLQRYLALLLQLAPNYAADLSIFLEQLHSLHRMDT